MRVFFGLLSTCVLALAKPLVVDLEAPWKPVSFAAQVLETVSTYNSTAYFPLLSLLLSEIEQAGKPLSDKRIVDFVLEKSIDGQFLSRPQLALVEGDLALQSSLATLQAHSQYFEEHFVPKVKDNSLLECENVFYYNGKATCDQGAVFALETNAKEDNIDITSEDHIIGGSLTSEGAPWAVLYADLDSPSFPVFHANLLASALEHKISYVLRYKPKYRAEKGVKLNGYHVGVQVKRTDYLVVDDRSGKDSSQKPLKLDVDAPNRISKEDLPTLPLKVSSYILSQKDKLKALFDVSLNLPSYFGELVDTSINSDIEADVQKNGDHGYFQAGTNALTLNGVPASLDIYDFIEELKYTVNEMEKFQHLGVSRRSAAKLITSDSVMKSNVSTMERYDIDSDVIIWLTNLEKSENYARYPNEASALLSTPEDMALPNARRNSINIVVPVDFRDIESIRGLQDVIGIIVRGLPIQVGIVPLDLTPVSNALWRICKTGSIYARQSFVVSLLKGADPKQAFASALQLSKQDGAIDDVYQGTFNEYTKSRDKWVKQFGVDKSVAFADGIALSRADHEWLYDAVAVLRGDVKDLQKLVTDGDIAESDTETNLRRVILSSGLKHRNPRVNPTDPSMLVYFDTLPLYEKLHGYFSTFTTGKALSTVWLIADWKEESTYDQWSNLLELVEAGNITLKVAPLKPPVDQEELVLFEVMRSLEAVPLEISRKAVVRIKQYLFEDRSKPEIFDKTEPKFTLDETNILVSSAMSEIFNTYKPSIVNLIIDGRFVPVSREAISPELLLQYVEREKPRLEKITEFFKQENQENIFLDATATLAMRIWSSSSSPRITDEKFVGSERALVSTVDDALLDIIAVLDPASEEGQNIVSICKFAQDLGFLNIKVYLSPGNITDEKVPNRYLRPAFSSKPNYDENGSLQDSKVEFSDLDDNTLYTVSIYEPTSWVVMAKSCDYDLDNVILNTVSEDELYAKYELKNILLEGQAFERGATTPLSGAQLRLSTPAHRKLGDTMVMANVGYFQLLAQPGLWEVSLEDGLSSQVYSFTPSSYSPGGKTARVWMKSMNGRMLRFLFNRNKGQEDTNVLEEYDKVAKEKKTSLFDKALGLVKRPNKHADINIFTVASGHLYERFLSIMTMSVMRHTKHTVKFWLIENFLSPSFKEFLPSLSKELGFEYELVTYKWPQWLRQQSEKQREIWGYKILFLDVLFPQSLSKVIFVDSDQIVRTDMKELVDEDLEGAPYGYTPMGDDREETEGFRFWKEGYWKKRLGDKPYHISALYVVDLDRFRGMGAGDNLRSHYQQLSADPKSLSNLDQDLPNNLQHLIPIHSLDQDWLWCETWCSDESLKTAKTIDLCNNPLTKEPKLDRARRQIPEWTEYDDKVAALRSKYFASKLEAKERVQSQEKTKNKASTNTEKEEDIDHQDL